MTGYRRIGGPTAITRWSFLLTATVLVGTTLLAGARGQDLGTPVDRLAIAVGSVCVALPVLALFRLSIMHAGARPARPATAIAAFALTGGVQAMVAVLLRTRLGLAVDDPAEIIIARAAAAAIWLSFVAILVADVREHGARVAQLRARIAALDALRRDETADAAQVRQRLRDEVLEPLRRTLDDIASRLRMGEQDRRVRSEADAIRRLADEEVRPLSHDLLLYDGPEAPPVAPDPLSGRERLAAVARLSVSAIAAPLWLAVLLPVVLVLLFSPPQVGAAFAGAAAVSGALLLAGGFLLGRRLLDPILPGLPVVGAAAAVLAFYLAQAAIGIANIWAWGDASPLGRWIEWPLLLSLPVIWFGLALRRAVEVHRRDVEDRLEATVAEHELVAARRRQRQRHAYQSLGRHLHGGVQAVLLADAERVARAAGLPDADRAAALHAVGDDLHALRDRLMTPPIEPWSAQEALDDVIGLWEGLVDIRVEADGSLPIRLDRAPSTRAAVVDVIAEALANAVRHGGARRITIVLRLADPHRLQLEVLDDGRWTAPDGPGMGTRLFTAVTASWSLDADDDGTRLRALLPIDADAPDG